MEKLLQLYKFVDGVNDTPFPNASQQAILYEFRYDAKRMGSAPTISGTIMHPQCLDDLWGSDLVYVTYNDERYFLKQTPTSSYSNEDTRYRHEVDFVSERIVLNDVYFYDVVQGDSSVDKPASNNSNFTFSGDIHEFASRLNYSLQYAKVGYRVVVDSGISSATKMVSFQNQFITNALQEIYNTYEIPYYFVGKVIHIGFTNNAITKTFKYGVDDALLSITKTNANYKIVNRVTGIGSSDNIPYYYPNASPEDSSIIPQPNLMPPIYRESLGNDRFYNALNNTYINPQTNDYYEFANPYQDGKPKEQIVSFEHIKPTIKGITNASGARIDMFSEFAYDKEDNDKVDEEGNFLHPYFFAKLRKFNGSYGFNLFDHAIDEGEMIISMTSGSCSACNFVIGVDGETQKNTVQVDKDGNLLRDEDGKVLFGSPQDTQNDTRNNEVWIALKKDIETFGIIMPNAANNYRPKVGDTFVVLHIDLPRPYILAAENELKEEIIKYMAMNNSEKFTFSINFSRIFFAENPDILSQLNENARLQIEYNDKTYELYVSSYSYNMTSDKALPEIRVELSDTLTVTQNALQTAISEVKTDIMNSVGSIDWLRLGLKYFLRKDTSDRSKGKVASDVGFEVGKFVSGASGAIVYVDKETKQTVGELDKLYVRMKAYFEQLEIVNVNSVGGKQIISPAGSIRCNKVEDKEYLFNEDGTPQVNEQGEQLYNEWDFYRCYFLNEQDGEKIENRFVVGDQAYCELFNAQADDENKISNKYYWRLVVGVGENYIDLSKEDCDKDSDIPDIGDVICHKGNRNDIDRQNVIEFSSVDSFSPSITLYQGIGILDKGNGLYPYSLADKDVVSFGVDKTTGQAFMNVYGDMYVGDRSQNTYIKYTQEKGLELKGKLEVGSTISDAMTVVEDGLIQSTLLKLGYYKDDVFKIMSGTNGLYDENVLGGGIAAWYGGPMADKEADSSLIEYAQSLFRFDGSGYLAGGNITWDKDGAGSVAGGDIKWDKDGAITLGVGIKISGDANETLGSILNLVNKIASWFDEDEDTGAIYVKKKGSEARDFYTYGAISFGGVGEGSGGAGGGGITTFDVFVGNNGPYPLQNGKVNLPAYPVVPNALPNPFKLTINGTTSYDGSAPVDIEIKAGVDDAQLSNYAEKKWVEENFTPIDAHNTLSQRVTALENSGTGGGSGGTTSVVSYNPSVLSGKLLGTLIINGVDNKIYAPAIPTKLSAFTNDENYVTEGWVNNQGFLTSHQSLTHLLSKEEAVDTYQPKGNYVTESALSGKGYLTQSDAEDTYQPKGDYAELDVLSSYLLASTAKNTYATKTALNNAIQAHDELREEFDALNGLLTDDTSGYIDTWNEVKIFLDGYSESPNLATILSGMNKDIANRATIEALNGATARISTLETTLSTEQGYIDTLQGYFTSGKANKAIADGDGNNIIDTYATKVALSSTNTNLASLSKEFSEFKELVNSLWYLDPDHANTVRTKLNVVVEQAISFGGYGESSGSGGGITTVTKQMILDALEYTPYDEANPKGYITSSALSGYAKLTDIPSLSGYATQTWVENKGYFASSSFTKANIKSTLGISDWALAASKPTYTKSDVGLGNVTNLAASGYLTDLGSNATNAVSITVGGTTKNISVSTLKTSLGLGSLAYKSSLVASDIPSLDWSKITSGKPTTLSGYGITDAYTKGAADLLFFGLDVAGIDADGVTNLNKVGYGYATGGWYGSGPALAFGSTNGYTALIQQGTSTYTLHVSYKSNGGDIQDWKTIAFTDSNVASATKLKTARSLWGQSFDGSSNVTGSLFYVLNINPDTAHNYSCGASDKPWNVVYTRYLDTYSGYDLRFRTGGTEQMRIAANSGCVILGGSSASENSAYKLDVQGVVRAMNSTDGSGVIIANQGNTIDGYYNGWGNLYLNYTSSGNVNIAVGGGNVGIGTRNPSSKLHVVGNIVATGSITFGSASDRRLKDNIKSMTDKQAVAVLSALNPVTFNWNSTAYELGKLSGTSDGFIADEYEKLIPNSGRDIWANYRAINYERATSYLVKGWQNHETRLEKAERRIKELENELKQYKRN